MFVAATTLEVACGTTLEELAGLSACKVEDLLRNQAERLKVRSERHCGINSGETHADQDVASTFLFRLFCGHASRVRSYAGESALPTHLQIQSTGA